MVEIPFGETRRWEMTRPDELQRRPALRDLYIAMNTTRGPLARRAGAPRAQPRARTSRPSSAPQMAGRGVRAAGAIPPGILGYDSTRAPYAWDTAGARRLLAEAGYAEGLPAPALAHASAPSWPGWRSRCSRISACVGIRVEIVERDASSVRAAVRNGEADLFLGDWYADYPDPENFTYPLFHSSNKGPGGNYAFLARHRARRA